MATRKIVELGNDKLRKECKPVDKFDLRLRLLLHDMTETMHKANGVGLAGPQVGVLKRVIVVDCGNGLFELVNPEIVAVEGEQTGPEGCLSIPGRRGVVTRPNKVTVKAQNFRGDSVTVSGEGLLARAFCHEIDHLNGIMYIDKMEREIFADETAEEEK